MLRLLLALLLVIVYVVLLSCGVSALPYEFPSQENGCSSCCLKGLCKMKVPCAPDERLDYQWVYFVPYRENVS